MMAFVGFLVHQTGGIKYVFSHSMYLPIILAAYYFHIPGGVLAGLLGGLLLGPLMPITVVTGEMQEVTNWVYRTVIFTGIGFMLGMMFGVAEKRLTKIGWLVNHAPETGLPNLSHLMESLEKIVAEDVPDSQYVLIAICITNHAQITSMFNVEEINMLSVKYAEKIQSLTDGKTTIYHLSPQFFCIFFKHEGSKQAIIDSVEKNFSHLESPIEINHIPLFFNINIGIAVDLVENLVPSSFYRKAKLASQVACEQDLKYVFYHPEAAERARTAQEILGDIPRAIKNNEFELYYQPILEVASGNVVGMEELIRWNHKSLGFLLPNSFLPISENTSLVFMIHDWVIASAIHQLSKWDNFRGYLSINLSTRLLLDQQWIDSMAALLKEFRIDASRMVFEVTESSLIVDGKRSIDTLSRICDLGAKVAIDDFGTGYSSFEYIYMLPVNYLKIDRRFIKEAVTSTKSREIVKSIIMLADALEIESIAEGIETEGQLEWLRQMQCEYVQGFYIGRPQSSKVIDAWLQANALPLRTHPTQFP